MSTKDIIVHSSNDTNPYTIIPTSYVIHLITTVELNNMAIFYDFHDFKGVNYLFTIFRYKKDYCNYVIVLCPDVNSNENEIKFFGVNYDGVLLQSFVMDNTFNAPVSIVRSNVSLYWRGEQYSLTFKVPNVNLFSIVKESILNIFTFPNKTFITQNDVVINFTLVDDYYFPSYFGQVNYDKKQITSKTTWDWCRGVLVGKLNEQIVYLWNSLNFAVCNQFPELDDRKQQIIIGGVNDYSYNLKSSPENIIVKATYANGLGYQSDEILGERINYIPVKAFIPLNGFVLDLELVEAYIIAFSNVTENSLYPTYAVIGTSSFKSTKRSIITDNVVVQFVIQKDPSFQNYKELYYKYDSSNKTLLVWKNDELPEFFVREQGQIVLSDIIPYNLGSLGKYNPLTNNLSNITKEFQFFDVFFQNIPLEGTFSQEQINQYYKLSGSQQKKVQDALATMVGIQNGSTLTSGRASGRKSGYTSSDFVLTPEQQQLFNSLSPDQQELCLMCMSEMKKSCGL